MPQKSRISENNMLYWNRLKRVLNVLQRIQDDLQMNEHMMPSDDAWFYTYRAKVATESAMLALLDSEPHDLTGGSPT